MLKVIAALAPGGAGVQLDRITLAQPNGKSLGAQHAKLTDNLKHTPQQQRVSAIGAAPGPGARI